MKKRIYTILIICIVFFIVILFLCLITYQKKDKSEIYKNKKYTTKVIESLSEKVCYEEEDIITYDQSGYISSIDIRKPDTAERLFQCIRNSQYIHDLTGANLEPKHLPICINGEAMGDFGSFYSYVEGDIFIEFIFTEEDSKAFYEYFME